VGGSLNPHVDISIKKAFTARAFDIETKELGKLAQPGGSGKQDQAVAEAGAAVF
jgi:uncharacterized protein GlcG (DUF336 family)